LVKIAIFGGSFDPPHIGHHKVVEKALEVLDIDKLIIVPAYLNPFKYASHATPNERLHWCKQVFAHPKVEISSFEIDQHKSIYSAHTIAHFMTQYEVKYFIIGADNLGSLNKWYNFKWINEHITWAIAHRDGIAINTAQLQEWIDLSIEANISSTMIRNALILDHVDHRIKDEIKKVYS
jgi:nicotinate-nucleotide adenylyltransferase